MFSRSGSYELQVSGKYDQRSYHPFMSCYLGIDVMLILEGKHVWKD